jgi:hypothetical protein
MRARSKATWTERTHSVGGEDSGRPSASSGQALTGLSAWFRMTSFLFFSETNGGDLSPSNEKENAEPNGYAFVSIWIGGS